MLRFTPYPLAVIFALILCSSATGQITSVGPPEAIQSNSNGGVLDEVSLVILDVTFDNSDPQNNIITATLTGDINFTPQEGLLNAGYALNTGFELTVGQFPVHLFNVAFIADGKLVNGGGTFNAPFTDLQIFAGLNQVNPNLFVTGVGLGEQITGNGFEYVQGSPLMAPYVLAAGETYHFGIGMLLDIETVGLFNDPTSVVSHEFGGASAFDGYKLQVLARAVPEPASVALLGLGGLVLMWRRVD